MTREEGREQTKVKTINNATTEEESHTTRWTRGETRIHHAQMILVSVSLSCYRYQRRRVHVGRHSADGKSEGKREQSIDERQLGTGMERG